VFDCSSGTTGYAYPPVFRGDGVCENHYSYLQSMFTTDRYQMTDCTTVAGDPDCPSEYGSDATRVVFSFAAFAVMAVLALFVL